MQFSLKKLNISIAHIASHLIYVEKKCQKILTH